MTYAKGKYCSNCGEVLKQKGENQPELKIESVPVAPKEPAKEPAKDWVIEASVSGENGQYNIAVQITKNGEGVPGKVWIGVSDGEDTVETNDGGFVIIPVIVTEKSTRVTLRILGCQADIAEFHLKGPKFQKPTNGGFREAFWARVNWNRGIVPQKASEENV